MPKIDSKLSAQNSERHSLPYAGGIGIAFRSPVKRNKRKEKAKVGNLGETTLKAALFGAIDALDDNDNSDVLLQQHMEPPQETALDPSATADSQYMEEESCTWDQENHDLEQGGDADLHAPLQPTETEADRLFANWSIAMDRLMDPFLDYMARTTGKALDRPPTNMGANCNRDSGCPLKNHTILVLLHDSFEEVTVQSCECDPVGCILVRHGLFPTSPIQPRMAVSISLLDLYQALFERSCDAVTAFTDAMHTYYKRRGFVYCNLQGNEVDDAWRRSVAQAIQWYDNLRAKVNNAVAEVLQTADKLIRELDGEQGQECSSSLQEKCPACFGGRTFGAPTEAGADIHVSLDGNFSHRHLRRPVDEGKQYHVPPYYVSKEYVDKVGEAMSAAKTRPAKARKPKVPDEAVDGCEDGHIAGKGTNVKTSTQIYDDTGTMALCCRHDIPIFVANIDTPGEQQKYAVALLKVLYSHLPANATVIAFYDVGCVLDRSLQTYDYLPEDITSRLSFVTSAMHAYAHQWACQLVYNPRMRPFIGLSDGEGTERIWSRLRRIIPLARVSGRSRRLWLINNLLASVGEEMRDGLGEWLKRRSSAIANFRRSAQAELDGCETPVAELRLLWEEQRASQSSIRSHHASRVKKDLDAILHLQADLDVIDDRLESVASGIAKDYPSGHKDLILSTLKACHETLNEKIETLFSNLNVGDSYPDLKGMDYEFVKTLLVMRDLKINIRKRAIANFFEYERLNQAAGGRNLPLGTNAHQLTRKAIGKRQPALQGAVRRFNTLRLKLVELRKPEWNIPVPSPLPTTISELRDHSDLMEDVWISPSPVKIPRWLEDEKARKGIRAMLKLDHCQEEILRLGREADNMCRWYGRELARIEVALSQTFGSRFRPQLEACRQKFHLLSSRWASKFASRVRFDTHITESQKLPDRFKHQALHKSSTTTSVTTFTSPSMRAPDGPGDCLPAVIEDDLDIDDAACQALEELCSEWNGTQDLQPFTQATFELDWTMHSEMQADMGALGALSFTTVTAQSRNHGMRRVALRQFIRPGIVEFCSRSLDIMESPSARLNDVCINSGSAFLQHLFSSPSSESEQSARLCAIFSTFDLPASKTGCSLTHLFRKTQHTLYWERPCWILPIHDPEEGGHWVVCIVYPLLGQMLVFDSLARREFWDSELPHILTFIERLVIAANTNGKLLAVITDTCWKVYSAAVQRIQVAPTSCGVWVLAQIAAILRGYHVTGLNEDQLVGFRALLYRLIHTLPVVPPQ